MSEIRRVLIKRDNGDAFFSEVEHMDDGSHREGGSQLSPDDLVDGKAVRDWPTGVHSVDSLEVRSTDWSADTTEIDHDKK